MFLRIPLGASAVFLFQITAAWRFVTVGKHALTVNISANETKVESQQALYQVLMEAEAELARAKKKVESARVHYEQDRLKAQQQAKSDNLGASPRRRTAALKVLSSELQVNDSKEEDAVHYSHKLLTDTSKATQARQFIAEKHAVLQGFGMALPAMFSMWLGYAFQVENVRDSTRKTLAEEVELPMSGSWGSLPWKILWVHWPGRMLATFAVGVSTFMYSCTFHLTLIYFGIGRQSIVVSFAIAIMDILITTPVWTVIMRMQRDFHDPPYGWHVHINRVYSEKGLHGLYAGLLPNLLLTMHPVVQSHTYYVLTKIATTILRESEVDLFVQRPYLSGTMGSLAAIAAATVTYPLHLLRNRWQAGLSAAAGDVYASTYWELGRMMYLGIWSKILHVSFTGFVCFSFKEMFYVWMVDGQG